MLKIPVIVGALVALVMVACLAVFLAVAWSMSARAADFPVKANAQPQIIPACGAGLYFGINTTGTAGAVSGSPVPGASIVQGELGAHVGYTSTVGACTPGVVSPFWFIEGNIDWTNLNGTAVGPTGSPTAALGSLNLTGPLDLFQRVGYGNPAINTFLSSLPGLSGLSTPSLPVLPAGVTATTAVPYLYLGVHEQDVSAFFVNALNGMTLGANKEWEISPEIGIGMWTRLSNNVVVDVSAGYQIQSNGICLGVTSMCPGLGNMWRARLGFNF
jgi:hypothetical protein